MVDGARLSSFQNIAPVPRTRQHVATAWKVAGFVSDYIGCPKAKRGLLHVCRELALRLHITRYGVLDCARLRTTGSRVVGPRTG